VEATFQSGGPVGTIVDVEACSANNAYVIALNPLFAVCHSDESASPIVAPNAVVCNAVFPSAIGELAQVELFRRSPTAPGGLELVGAKPEQITEADWQVDGPFSNQGQIRGRLKTARTKLPAGDYLCRFMLNGSIAADREFHLVP
jgi:hypothetical protein